MEQTYEERKQEILSKIFLTHEQVLEWREKNIEEREKQLETTIKINKELKMEISNIEKKIGHIMRDFELKINIPKETKHYFNQLWDYFCKEIPKRFSSNLETIEEEKVRREKLIKKHKNIIRELKRNRRGRKR